MDNMRVGILGAGAFGTALGEVLMGNHHDVKYYDLQWAESSLADVVSWAEYIVLCVPSSVVEMVLPELPKGRPLIVATKGILGAGMFAGFADMMVLSGPGFAQDIAAKQPTLLTATDARVVEMFATDYLTFDQTRDAQGVLLCGALKNVYALLAGYLGLERESAAWEQFIAEVAGEMQALLAANWGDPATVQLACGVGDLRLTCGIPSRNYEFGQMLKNSPQAQPDKTVEGWTALAKIKRGDLQVPETAEKLRFLIEQSATWG